LFDVDFTALDDFSGSSGFNSLNGFGISFPAIESIEAIEPLYLYYF